VNKDKVLIIGNKPYKNLSIGKLIDNFQNNVRCNFSIPLPEFNNGAIYDELALCNHQWSNLVQKNLSLDDIIKLYRDAYNVEYMQKYYSLYKKSLKNYKRVWYAKEDTRNFNEGLSNIGCPYKISAIPRTGYTVMLQKILEGKSVFVTNFSIQKEVRFSIYVDKEYSLKEYESEKNKKQGKKESIPTCHDSSTDVKILRWLHDHKIIDASLCFLQDVDDRKYILDPNLEKGVISDYISELVYNFKSELL
tara:strand:- start:117 stop:863 length:747 start_codon:yes stop_codon:yes gene_type:complete